MREAAPNIVWKERLLEGLRIRERHEYGLTNRQHEVNYSTIKLLARNEESHIWQT